MKARPLTESTDRPAGGRWTATSLLSLPPGTHTDPAQLGLQLRVRALKTADSKPPRYSRSWLLRVKFRNEETRLLLGHPPAMALADARIEAQRLRELAARGIDPRRATPRRRDNITTRPVSRETASGKNTVDFLCDEFITRYLRPSRKRPEYAESIIARDILPRWRGRDARTIEPSEVIELLDGIVERGSAVMANRVAALLGQLFRFAIHRRIVATTPVQLLLPPGGKEKPRVRALTDDELRAFLANPIACTRFDRLARVILVLLLTGQRRGELAAARWSEIDFERRVWTIPPENAKNGRPSEVPLSAWAIDEFRGLKRTSKRSSWVLPADDTEEHLDAKFLTRSLARCLDRFAKAGIAPFRLHDLRRTTRTGLARLKVAPHIAELVIGHQQDKLLATYDAHSYFDEKRAALEQWESHLRKLAP